MISILIPSKKEPYLQQTIDDIYKNAEGEIEILVGLDGYFRVIDEKSPVKLFMAQPSIGQRAITNMMATQASGEYLMKLDAHCSLSKGFDVKMLSEIDDKTILAPLLLPLDENWSVNGKKQMAQFVFNRDFVMQHAEGDVGETMCLQGSCWLISKENYFKWNVCDETLGSWGGQAVELGIKAYLNGGVCKTTRSAYYGHLFRHEDKDFPYEREKEPGKKAVEELKRRYSDKIDGLVKKFNYPCDW